MSFTNAKLTGAAPDKGWGRMQIEPLVTIDQVRQGDLLLIGDSIGVTLAKAQRVKVSEHDGTEVIFNLRKNRFFNVGMYLDGKSWAKDVRIVRLAIDK